MIEAQLDSHIQVPFIETKHSKIYFWKKASATHFSEPLF